MTRKRIVQCLGKLTYVSPQEAWRASNGFNGRLKRTGQTGKRHYHCETCGLWHLGEDLPQYRGRPRRD